MNNRKQFNISIFVKKILNSKHSWFLFQAILAFFAWQRYKAGFDSAFGGGIDEATLGQGGEAAGYQAYQTEAGGFSQPPFSQQGRVSSSLKICLKRDTTNSLSFNVDFGLLNSQNTYSG